MKEDDEEEENLEERGKEPGVQEGSLQTVGKLIAHRVLN
jgi:hypothetical protein